MIQQGVSAPDKAVLTNDGNVETFEFHWRRPQETGDETPRQAWDRRRQQRRGKQLGISSYGAVYSFVYIQNHEVRIEILVPLLTLETWVEVERASREFLEIDEQPSARNTLGRFLYRRNVVHIDGEQITPTLQRLDYYGVEFRDFAMQEQGGAVSRVKEVQVIDSRITGPAAVNRGLDVRLKWSVEHRGHIHTRVNQYEADSNLRAIDNAWKIVAMEMLDQRRVKYHVGVRGF